MSSASNPSNPNQKLIKRSAQTADVIFRRLLEAILSGEFPSGSRLREAQLARSWNVSRTPLREAMRRAAEGGFIVLRPNRAPIVRPLSTDDIRQMYEVRELLELHALKLAWPHLDQQEISRIEALAARAKPESNRDWPNRCLEFDVALHLFWTQRSGNSWLQAELERFYQFLRIFQSWRGRDQQALAEAYAEHVAILGAIKKRDQSRALALLREHIRNSAQLLQKAMPKADSTPD